jgi:hypothetical protein
MNLVQQRQYRMLCVDCGTEWYCLHSPGRLELCPVCGLSSGMHGMPLTRSPDEREADLARIVADLTAGGFAGYRIWYSA